MIQQISVLLMLTICSYEDIKRRRIHIGWLVLFTAAGILYGIFRGEGLPVQIWSAMVPGLFLFLLSFLTRGGIGQGDGMLLMVMGIFLESLYVWKILLYALFLSAGYALFLFFIRKKGRKYEIAFVPFLLAAFIGGLFCE